MKKQKYYIILRQAIGKSPDVNCDNLEIPLSEDLRFSLKKEMRYDTMIKNRKEIGRGIA